MRNTGHCGTENPLISTIIPVYNGSDFLKEAIECVLEQTLQDFELIIIDDGSTDLTADIAKSYHDARIKYHYQTNQGLSRARNAGIKQAKGKYLAFLDCDDIWLPEKLETQLIQFESNSEAGLVYCATQIYDTNNRLVKYLPTVFEGNILKSLLMGNFITGSASSVMVPRVVIDNVGLFDETLGTCEDWDLWLRIAALYPIIAVRKPLVRLLTRPDSLGKNIEAVRDDSFKLIDKAFATYASHLRYMKNQAFAQIHFTAGIAFGTVGIQQAARHEFMACLRLSPLNFSALWRLVITFAGRYANRSARNIKDTVRLAYLKIKASRQREP
jgi:glycosyltransferase involved in cell wall biosynthesis